MSKEIAGTINKVIITSDGRVVKAFEDNGLVERSARHRQNAEALSLIKFEGLSPTLFDVYQNKVEMSVANGENHLNSKLPEMSEALQQSVFTEAGRTLRQVHELGPRARLTPAYHQKVVRGSQSKTAELSGSFLENNIDPVGVFSYLENAYKQEEVDRLGAVHTHGDFWLNNLMGGVNGNSFTSKSVIDWEMASLAASPYEDYAIIELSIESPYPQSKLPFWEGYGFTPDPRMKRYFAIMQILTWMNGESNKDYSSEFYQEKLDLIRVTI